MKIKPLKVTHEEICDHALKEYEEMSSELCRWNNTIPKAIQFYKEHGERIDVEITPDFIKEGELND